MLFSHFTKGPVAEWLGKALQKLLQRFEPARDLDTKPVTQVTGFFNAIPRREHAPESGGALKKSTNSAAIR